MAQFTPNGKILLPPAVVGIIGGGQLARMLAISAIQMGYKVAIYSDIKNAPAEPVCHQFFHAEYSDLETLKEFYQVCDVITFEFENLPVESISIIEKKVFPSLNNLRIFQHRLLEKNFINKAHIETVKYQEISPNEIKNCKDFSFPAIVKTATLGYDGKGQYKVKSYEELSELNLDPTREYIIEEMIKFDYEISCIMARNASGDISYLPIPKNTHENGILATSEVGVNIVSASMVEKATVNTAYIMEKLNYIGVMTMEMFVCGDKVIANEIAPRVHNSGHYSIDLCDYSQFDLNIMAICNLPLPKVKLIAEGEMVNLIGKDVNPENILKIIESGEKLHLYDKGEARDGRKMGHFVRFKK